MELPSISVPSTAAFNFEVLSCMVLTVVDFHGACIEMRF